MSIIQKALNDLLESNEKYEPHGHDIRFYLSGKNKRSVYMSSGFSEESSICIYLYKDDLTPEQQKKLKDLKLQFSKNVTFEEFGKKGTRIRAEFELQRDYIEKLILKIFGEIFEEVDVSNLQYDINPI